MKVLVVTANSRDMNLDFFWDGLRTVLGDDNVVDAVDSAALRGMHADRSGFCPNTSRHVNPRPDGQHRTLRNGEDNFDMILAAASFLREHDWNWLANLRARTLKKDGKFVWYETLDAPTEFFPPPFPVDAVFKREIDPNIKYPWPHKPLSLLCGMPERWMEELWTDEKPYDVFNVQNSVTTGWPTRWETMSQTFNTKRRVHGLAGAGVLQPVDVYLHVARMFKLVVVSPGGGCSSDSTRTWETIAMGGIPLFVGQPVRPRWPWLEPDEIFWCDRPDQMPDMIVHALDNCDLNAMRLKLKAHALKEHTTAARARQLLYMVEMDAWRNPGPWSW